MARPTKYKPEFAKQASQICKLGATDKDLADIFGVDERTINTWKQKHDEFFQSLKKGKDYFDCKVETALAERAIGFKHPEEKIFLNGGEVIRIETTKHYPPDVTACIYWLNNRKSKEWASRKAVEAEITVDKLPEGTGVLMTPDVLSIDDWTKLSKEANQNLTKKEKKFMAP
ncbi:helix-turn-helix domain-containing protein [Marinicella rhabdoformis]|uniref:helix-turn-helix domain-containing protein n=1 Tax=Marinicella rhabdoformis TaxID=2580566 RepID=UPI0012AECCC3|nr:helix-turn-helix domain-containing protein [Marinicella rhabdoformis]